MKWAIVFYAILTLNGETKEHISWGLTFNHHEQCMKKKKKNKEEIIGGIKTYAQNNIDPFASITELGCAHATADFENGDQEQTPMVTLKMPLWYGDAT